jgi:Phosphodiester glycosidase
MRILFSAAMSISLAGCFPAPPPLPTVTAHAPRKNTAITAVKAPTPSRPVAQIAAPAPPTSLEATRFTRQEIAGILFEGVAFDSRNQRLVVVDQAGGPGSQYEDAEAAGHSRGGVAAINAGFFTPEGAPLGLVVAAGKAAGSWNSSSSLGSGIWVSPASGQSTICRRNTLGRPAALAMQELIQAGPLLIENSRTVSGLDPLKASPRSLILWDGASRWWIGRAAPCSLAALGDALAAGQPAGWAVVQALNFDGGRSADLWVSSSLAGESLVRRSLWNRPVRNFLVLTAN